LDPFKFFSEEVSQHPQRLLAILEVTFDYFYFLPKELVFFLELKKVLDLEVVSGTLVIKS
jgi:hypothetical protein